MKKLTRTPAFASPGAAGGLKQAVTSQYWPSLSNRRHKYQPHGLVEDWARCMGIKLEHGLVHWGMLFLAHALAKPDPHEEKKQTKLPDTQPGCSKSERRSWTFSAQICHFVSLFICVK